MLRARTACSLGDDVARQLQPTVDRLTISEGQRETSEAAAIVNEEGSLPLGGLYDIRPYITKAQIDSLLQPSELLEVAGTLSSARRLRTFVLKRGEKSPKLGEIAVNIGQFPKLEDSIYQSISENAEIRDTASAELARVRSKLKITHSRMMDRLHAIIQSAQYRTMIQDPVITQRGDRYCIPVKSEHRPQFPGIVHDSSASGATVFVEPASVVEMGNDLKELALKEQQEIDRILRMLSGSIRAVAPDLVITCNAVGRIDFASAKGRLSCDMDASEPILNRDGKIDMKGGRHPLLRGDVVPIDVDLGRSFQALLITGPNTGGKTVTLKTVGLLTLMAQSGLHVPAESGTELAIFDRIFADIGDEQSIQQSLSTFSSHMLNIVHITRDLGPNALVLLDEVGAGTDPEEGAALAKAILDHLVTHNARTIATTHYGELKEYAFAREDVMNASVEFDIQTLRPTYRLLIGIPGSSNAFSIASRLGLSDEIVGMAREQVTGGRASDEIIRKIEETQRSVSEKEQLADRSSRDAEILRTRYEKRLDEIEELRRQMRLQLAEELERRVKERVAELDQIVEEVKQHRSEPRVYHENRQKFRRRVIEIRQEVDELLPQVAQPDEPYALAKGDTVTVTSYGVDGVLMNDPGDHDAIVMVGSMRVNVPFSTLRPSRAEKKSGRPEVNLPMLGMATDKAMNVSSELKLIAQRVEQALENLDKYLDDAYLGGLSSARIIHGKGTGTLKRAVWEYLAGHHAVASYHLADAKEGGSGATIVKFKER